MCTGCRIRLVSSTVLKHVGSSVTFRAVCVFVLLWWLSQEFLKQRAMLISFVFRCRGLWIWIGRLIKLDSSAELTRALVCDKQDWDVWWCAQGETAPWGQRKDYAPRPPDSWTGATLDGPARQPQGYHAHGKLPNGTHKFTCAPLRMGRNFWISGYRHLFPV